jgi:hypothetical protein
MKKEKKEAAKKNSSPKVSALVNVLNEFWQTFSKYGCPSIFIT